MRIRFPVGESNPDRPRDRRKYYAVILTGFSLHEIILKRFIFFCHADSAWKCHAESAWEEEVAQKLRHLKKEVAQK